MDKNRFEKLVDSMEPLEAAEEMAAAAKTLFSVLGEAALRDFLSKLIGDKSQDDISGLVYL